MLLFIGQVQSCAVFGQQQPWRILGNAPAQLEPNSAPKRAQMQAFPGSRKAPQAPMAPSFALPERSAAEGRAPA
jgi:hypothetical protein